MGFFQLFHVVYLLLERICLRRLRSPLLHHCCNAFSALLCFHFTAFFAFDFFATNLFCLRPLKWHIQVSLLSSSLLFIYEAFLFFFCCKILFYPILQCFWLHSTFLELHRFRWWWVRFRLFPVSFRISLGELMCFFVSSCKEFYIIFIALFCWLLI